MHWLLQVFIFLYYSWAEINIVCTYIYVYVICNKFVQQYYKSPSLIKFPHYERLLSVKVNADDLYVSYPYMLSSVHLIGHFKGSLLYDGQNYWSWKFFWRCYLVDVRLNDSFANKLQTSSNTKQLSQIHKWNVKSNQNTVMYSWEKSNPQSALIASHLWRLFVS